MHQQVVDFNFCYYLYFFVRYKIIINIYLVSLPRNFLFL